MQAFKYACMAKHWPHQSRVQITNRERLTQILNWMKENHGDWCYQHWTSEYTHPWLTIKFCDKHIKTQFDLTWS